MTLDTDTIDSVSVTSINAIDGGQQKKKENGIAATTRAVFFLRVIQWTCLEQLMRDVVVLLRVVCYSNPENRRIAGVYWVI